MRSPRPAPAASGRSTSTCCTTSRTARSRPGSTRRGRARPGARPPVALCADPRRSRRGGPDRPRRRPPADDEGRPALARRRDRRPGRGSRGRPVPPRRPPPRRRRLARLRDQQLGATRPREPPQPRLLGAPAVRGGRPRGARVRRREPALERGPPRPLPRGPRPGEPDRRPCPPGGSETIDAETAATETVVLGLRTDARPAAVRGDRAAARRQSSAGPSRPSS